MLIYYLRASGMLLYAKTNAHVQPDQEYRMSGNTISVETLDLNCEFAEVSAQLKEIVNEYYGVGIIGYD